MCIYAPTGDGKLVIKRVWMNKAELFMAIPTAKPKRKRSANEPLSWNSFFQMEIARSLPPKTLMSEPVPQTI